jgi:erythromycin esterase
MKRLLQVFIAILVSFVFAFGQMAQTETTAIENGKPIERQLKAAEIHNFNVRLEAGQFFDAAVDQRGIDVVVNVFAPDGNKIAEIDSPNGIQGDEPIAFQAKTVGTYRIEVASLEKDAQPGRYEIRINEILSAGAYAARLAETTRKQQAVVARLKENAIPIKTVEAGNGFEDLQPLKRILKDVHFVGLGEETHGTREFFQFKHRMLEFLVREMGFRVFAIEASYSACENINDYVMGKTDDGAKALSSQGFWTWDTEEVRAMMDWMRSYNASVPANKKVKFVGFDIQVNGTGKAKLLEYLKRVAPERAGEAEAFFKIDEDELGGAIFARDDKAKESRAKYNELKNRYNDLFIFLELSGASLAAKSSQAEYNQMRALARVITQYLDSYSYTAMSGGVAARDLYMADNFRRIVSGEPAGTRFVLWAHNGHIATDKIGGSISAFGSYLRGFYGQDYYALGFTFNQGSFQAREAQPKDPPKRMLMSFTVNPAPVDSIDWYLAQTGTKTFVIDFRSARKNSELGEWLAAPRPMRSVGSIYGSGSESSSFGPIVISRNYDGLFFIDTTTRARPNPSVKNAVKQ